MMRALACLLALLGASGLAQAQCVANLPAGQTVTAAEPLPGNSLTGSVCIDVPAGAERLTVRLLGATPGADLDLLVRVDSPFVDPERESLSGLSVDDLFERAHYVSASTQGDEAIVISRASRQPLRAGRLYLVLVNFNSGAVGFQVGSTLGAASDFAPIDVSFTTPGTANSPCDLSGWTDPSPRAPIRGNTGTTLGEQRRNAMLEAARLLSEQLRPAVPIRLQACWAQLEFTETSGVLAQAGPRFLVVDDPGRGLSFPYLDARHTIHFTPGAAHQAGTSFCRFAGGNCSNPEADIRATFNLAVDNASNVNRRFDYGIERPDTLTGPSFVAVSMHELAHGLGFVGLVGLGGSGGALGTRSTAFGLPYDDSYGRHARIVEITSDPQVPKEFLRATDAERAAALTSGTALRFAAPRAVNALNNRLRDNIPPFNMVQLHAPTEVASGGTYSHLGAQHTSQLMLATATSPAIRTLGLGLEMLQSMGFDPDPKTAPSFPLPPDAQYFDTARNGHGIDFRRVAGTTDLYFLGFYSYDASGNPEWFTSLGRVVDGVFVPGQNEFGDSLLRFDYSPGPPPSSQVDASAGFTGEVRLDFVEAARSPVCLAGRENRALQGAVGLMTWTLGNETRQWCMQPLVGTEGVALDVSGVWFAPSDSGWGITVQSFPGAGGDGIAIGVYYPDANGKGRWGVVQAGNYNPAETYTVRQVVGYCRDPACVAPDNLSFVDIGTLRVDLKPPAEGPSTLTLDVTYPGPGGGRFQRTGVELTPANQPRFRGE